MYKRVSSPNFNERPASIDTVVIHSTHISKKSALERLCDPAAQVSAHYLIDLDGQVYQLVDDSKRAWHAGRSYWRGRGNLNDCSIGIELVDTDDANNRVSKFTSQQMTSITELLKKLVCAHKIKPYNIVAHSDIAPDRKDDPGEHFNWRMLHKHGIGLFHDFDLKASKGKALFKANDSGMIIKEIQEKLGKLGYFINSDGVYGGISEAVVIAFKRHFNQRHLNSTFYELDLKILESLLGKI